MSNRKAILGLLADRPVAYHPDLARITGGVKAAVFLSQLLFWSNKGVRSDGYIWKVQEEWERETGLTRYEQEGARQKLLESGLIEERRSGWPAKLYYRIKFDALYEAVIAYYEDQKEPDKDAESSECGKPANRDSLNAENPQTIDCGKPANFTESTRDDNTHSVSSNPRANFAALVELCKFDLDTITPTQRGKLNQIEKLLRKKKGVTVKDIKAFSDWWYNHWWQGKDNQPPRPMQIRENWGIFEQRDNAERSDGHLRIKI